MDSIPQNDVSGQRVLPAPRRFRLNPACKAQLVIFGQIAQQFGQLEAVDAITRLIREGGLSDA